MGTDAKLIEAIGTAVASSVLARLADVWESIAKPDSARRVIEEAPKTIALIEAWAKAQQALQTLPADELRILAEQKLGSTLRSIALSQEELRQAVEQRRENLFRYMGYLRLARLQGLFQRVMAFCFYVSLVMFLQSCRLYLGSRWSINPWTIPFLSLVSILSWVFSGSLRLRSIFSFLKKTNNLVHPPREES